MTILRSLPVALVFAGLSLVTGATSSMSQTPPLPLPEPSIARQVVDVGSGPSAVRYLLLSVLTPRPTTAVMLFAGGNGFVNIGENGSVGDALAGNFLVRSRMLFAQQGLAVAVIDAPGAGPLSAVVRQSPEYAKTLTAVIGDLRSRTGAQRIWLIGTSSGTLSVASIAGLYPQMASEPPPYIIPRPVPNSSRPNGIVLTATQTNTGSTPGTTCTATIFDKPFKLPTINVPAYVVADRSDLCPCSPPTRTGDIMNQLMASPRKASALFPLDGSPSPPGPGTNQCNANTAHGFYDIESDVVTNIANWIKRF